MAVFELPHDEEGAASPPAEYDAQRDRSLLWQNASWFCHLRWIVVAGLATIGVAAFFPTWTVRFGVQLSPFLPMAVAVLLAMANAVYLRWLRRLPADAPLGTLRTILWSQIVLDLLILTVVVHYLGSRATYAPIAYMFHIILACIFFRRSESFAVTAVSALMYIGLLLLESKGLREPTSVLVGVSRTGWGFTSLSASVWQLSSLLATWLIIWYLVSRLAGELRQRECELAETNRRLEASSAERARHMLQTTHQLKAPFAAIHANTQLLLGGYSGELPEEARRVVEKIATRSRMLSQQIQQMLQLANLRSQGQTQSMESVLDLSEILRQAVGRIEPQASMRSIRIETELEQTFVHGSEDYLKMLVDNLLTNAVNYSYDDGLVQVQCGKQDDGVALVAVRDHGIGIAETKLPRVFDDYYRTTEAAQHNKASTGLGLAIVRLVARALHADVLIESSPGWGTRIALRMKSLSNSIDDLHSNQGAMYGVFADH